MLNDELIDRPTNFTFMMIDQWSSEPYRDIWDIRNNYQISVEDNDLKVYCEFMTVCKKLLHFVEFPILIACYNLGYSHDHELFYRTFDFFHSYYVNKKDERALVYLRTLNEQLLSSGRERSKTLNRYFKNDLNLLILEKDALEIIIKDRNIKNLVIIGSAWEDCLKYRPVGFTNLDLSVCDYYLIPELCRTNMKTTVSEDDLIKCQQTRWIKCKDAMSFETVGMYKLIEIIK